MALIDHVYNDIGLTDQFDDTTDTLDAWALDASTGDGVFYVGTPTAGNHVQATSDPGVDPIVVSIVDSSPGGGVEDTHIKLATSSGALGSAVGGDPLNIGATIVYGTPVAVHYRWANSTGASTEISLSITARTESVI